MYRDIVNNKIKTGIIVVLFTAMISVMIYFVCNYMGYGQYSVMIALIFSIISSMATYYNSDKIVLAQVHAREATHEEDLQLSNIVDGLMVASGLKNKPRVYVVDSAQPNAFATGRDPEHAVICVNKGLIDKLNYNELEGVIAHEMSHIKNYDIRLSAVISVMVGFVIMLSDFVFRFSFRRRNSNNNSGGSNAILMIIGLVFVILSPLASQLIQLAVSRRREFLADATAVSFTRNPDALISALQKISSDPTPLETASKSTAHMYISNPFKKRDPNQTSLFSTHPSIADRCEAIRNLKY